MTIGGPHIEDRRFVFYLTDIYQESITRADDFR